MITVAPEEVNDILSKEKKLQVIDIRKYSSYKKSHLPGATSIPRERFAEFMNKIEKDLPILIYCQFGMKSDEIGLFLEKKYNSKVYILEGGYEAYIESM